MARPPEAQVRRVVTPPVSVQSQLEARQVVKWPNVRSQSLPRFNQSLKCGSSASPRRSGSPSTDIRPARGCVRSCVSDAGRVHPAVRSRWRRSSRRRDVHLFVYQDDRDSPGSPSCIAPEARRRDLRPRGSAPARGHSTHGWGLQLPTGTTTPLVTLYTRRYCVGDTTGEAIGMTVAHLPRRVD